MSPEGKRMDLSWILNFTRRLNLKISSQRADETYGWGWGSGLELKGEH